jgi:hypothetical protein
MPNPLDPYRGMGPVQTVLVDIGAEQAAAEWNRNFFRNSAEPGGIIEVEKTLSDDEFAEHLDRWREQHRGVTNAHRVALLEGGMKWVDRKYTNRDMEFTSLRAMSSTKLREAFGMPKFAVGDVEDVNRATAEASKAWFAEQLTVPRLERWKGALNNDLLRLYNATDTLEFDYDNPVPPDAEAENAHLTARSGAAKTLVDAGYDPAEVLETVGLPEMTHVGIPQAAAPAPTEEPAPEEEPPVPGRRGRSTALLNAADDEGREDWEDRLDDLIDAWAGVSADQRADLADQITKVVDSGKPEGLATLKASTDAGVEALTEAMFAQAAAAGVRMAESAAEAGVTISPVTPITPTTNLLMDVVRLGSPKYLAGLASDLKAIAKVGVSYLSGGYVASAAREAMRIWAPGSTGKEVAKAVTEHLEGLTDATLRAELGGAIWAAENEGRFATLEQAETDGNPAARYEASERRDTNTCGPCSQVDGKTFSKLSEVQAEYPCGGYRHCDGRARCRGTVEPIWY